MIRLIGWVAVTWILFATGIAQMILLWIAATGTLIFG